MKGKITISRPKGRGCDYITISASDSASGIEFVEINVKYSEFAEALTGASYKSCDFELRGVERVGMKRENKTESVFIPNTIAYKDTEAIRAEVAKHEVDGWIGYIPDASNNHRMTKSTKDGAYYTVGFTRWLNH